MKLPSLLVASAITLWSATFPHALGAPDTDIIRDVAPGGGVLVVKDDGSVATWGRSGAGMIQVPAILALPGKVLRVAVGGSNLGVFTGYALLEDGTVVSWGANDEGQLGNGPAGANVALGKYPNPSSTPQAVTGLSDIVDIDAGDKHALALRKDGTVWAWGWRENGVLGDGDTPPKGSLRVVSAAAPIQVPGLTNIIRIAAGPLHNLALTRDGRVMACGKNGNGELGLGTRATGWLPAAVPGLDHVIGIAAGSGGNNGGVSGALRDDGTVWTWGTNASSMIGNSKSSTEPDEEGVLHAAPAQVKTIAGAKQLAIGGGHVAVVLADGTVRMWGHNGYGQIGIGSTSGAYVVRPVKVPALTNVAAVYLGNMRSYAVRTDGSFWVWGFQHLDR
ncbi:MAG: hypothetical protein ABI120_20405, partial [Gemmatimonadaceae bacterium]